MKKKKNNHDELTSLKGKKFGKVNWLRDSKKPFMRHLKEDWEAPENVKSNVLGNISNLHQLTMKDLFALKPKTLRGVITPQWNSVALFFNLTNNNRPSDYQNTSTQNARNWLDEGTNPANPTISDFILNYWRTLSYGNLVFGINTPRNSAGTPLIPTLQVPANGAQDWGALIRACIEANPIEVWEAAGRLNRDGKRWIPSVVLVQKYWTHASAGFGGFEMSISGHNYLIGDVTHINYDLSFVNLSGVPANTVRRFWGTLCHEYAHNFLEFVDLYGPQGCTGYWDLLGDNSPPGRMSEVSSFIKERVGWLSFNHVIEGPEFGARNYSLRPYTSSGDCIKIIPDKTHNPHEFFTLEYRKSTGNETWKPDGALTEEGLLITHFNTRLGVSPSWLLREAPYFDPEFADFSDNGGALWTGHDRLNGILFPNSHNNSFTPYSLPNSNFYGQRPSGLYITNIRVENGRCKFNLRIQGSPRIGWTVSNKDRCLAGNFSGESFTGGQEIFCRNDDAVALLSQRQSQWFVVSKQEDWIDSWNLGRDNYEVVGDFDGDGLDEIYVRSPNWAGIFKWRYNRFRTITIIHDWIGEWNLGSDNYELAGDFDGDGKDEIYVRSPNWAGIIKLVGSRFQLLAIHHDWIDRWNLGNDNTEYVGKFSQSTRDEILIKSPEWLGLLNWNNGQRKLRLKQIQHDRIDGWNLSRNDKITIGDFDGDGRDEIYIRSSRWAGVLKWVTNRFKLLWIRENNLERLDGNEDFKIQLRASDLSYSGRFLPERDCILHRGNQELGVLSWEGNEMKIRFHHRGSHIGGWALGNSDKYVLGDFHRLGPDTDSGSIRDHIIDNLCDIFVHNSWGTGMFGINPPNNDNIALTWINHNELLYGV